MMCFCMQGFITMPNIPCYTYNATHTHYAMPHIPCHKYHATHTRHLPSHACDATHTMPYIHTGKPTHKNRRTYTHTHHIQTYRHTCIPKCIHAYVLLCILHQCCCNVVTANMTACKLQCLHKTLRLGASFETNIVLGEPEWCQKWTKIPPRDFEEALIF